MDQKTKDVRAAYEANAEKLIDLVAEALLKEGVKLEKKSEPCYQDGKDPYLYSREPSVNIKAEQANLGRYFPKNTEDVVLHVHIGGSKARYPKRKDGTYNLDGIVKNVLEAVTWHKEREVAMASYRKEQEENSEIQAKETAGIVVPAGASHAARDPKTGTYGFVFRGQFENLSLVDLTTLYEDLAALTKKYKFHPQT